VTFGRHVACAATSNADVTSRRGANNYIVNRELARVRLQRLQHEGRSEVSAIRERAQNHRWDPRKKAASQKRSHSRAAASARVCASWNPFAGTREFDESASADSNWLVAIWWDSEMQNASLAWSKLLWYSKYQNAARGIIINDNIIFPLASIISPVSPAFRWLDRAKKRILHRRSVPTLWSVGLSYIYLKEQNLSLLFPRQDRLIYSYRTSYRPTALHLLRDNRCRLSYVPINRWINQCKSVQWFATACTSNGRFRYFSLQRK